MINAITERKSAAHIIWFSIVASLLTIFLKSYAYYATGSVGFLSDAMESLINLAAALVALIMLTIAFRPPDKEHPFGHDKAEYFSSLIEGILIILAAIGIGYAGVERIINPKPLEELNFGMVLSVVATLINLGTAQILLFYSKRHKSITLEADAHHLMTDVWTTVGIIVGIGLVKITNWNIIDPLMAIAVAVSIVYTGFKLIKRSADGLMDISLPESELKIITQILDSFKEQGIHYHALYTRQVASKSVITFHLLLPDDWSIFRGHEVSKKLEQEIKNEIPYSDVFIHLEPLNDPDSFDDFLTDAKS